MNSEQRNRDNKGNTINPPREPAQRGRRRKGTCQAKNCPDNEAAGSDEFLLSVAQSCSLVGGASGFYGDSFRSVRFKT